ncbi:hypothetical protein Q1695_012687 [Nippostrongylus brasiliensis]|nr:hypothetical protein Q1695_012687 [Nippostrongylus brasiliensis]
MTSNVRSSLTYQLMMIGHRTFSVIFFLVILFVYFYKGSVLPYQNHVRILELLIILAFAPIEAVRLSWGMRGNLTETPAFLAFSSLLSVPVLLILVYLAAFQNYVLLVEAILVGINGILVIIETVASLALCATMSA